MYELPGAPSAPITPPGPSPSAPRSLRRDPLGRHPFLAFLLVVSLVAGFAVVLGPGQRPSGFGIMGPGTTYGLRAGVEGEVWHPARPGEGEFLLTTVLITPLTNNTKFWHTLWGRERSIVELAAGDGPVAGEGVVEAEIAAALLATSFLGRGTETYLDAEGVFVSEVLPGPLAALGMQPGDVVRAVDGSEVRTYEDLAARLATATGDLRLTVARGSESFELEVPFSPGAQLGVLVGTNWVLGGSARLRFGPVYGASGGLMFALTYLDLLTEGDLTGGARVAGTGTVSFTGQVGPVQGVEEKIAAASRDGASVFLLPTPLDRSASTQPPGLELVPVTSFLEALRFLCSRPGVVDEACTLLGAVAP